MDHVPDVENHAAFHQTCILLVREIKISKWGVEHLEDLEETQTFDVPDLTSRILVLVRFIRYTERIPVHLFQTRIIEYDYGRDRVGYGFRRTNLCLKQEDRLSLKQGFA